MRIEGVVLRRLEVHADTRGSFSELFVAHEYRQPFVQANHSRSTRGVLRGLHYHRNQDDLWYVVSGQAQVALVDLRERADPPVTETLLLDSDDPTTLLIPAGVAHGFFAVTDVNMIYFVTHLYDPNDEYGVAWNDPQLTIPWLADTPILSDRDEANPQLSWDTIPAFS